MEILLIYPPLSVKKRYGNRAIGKSGGHLPPLGIAYVAAFLRDKGFSVGIIDALASGMNSKDIVDYISYHKPGVVGLSALTSTFYGAVELAKTLKEQFPDILTLIGGHHATILPEETIRDYPCFDLLIYGEGEITSLEVMKRYREAGSDRAVFLNSLTPDIRGIVYRKTSEPYKTPPRALIDDLDTLPLPARDLLPMERYIPLPNQYKRLPVVHMLTTRGCPYSCIFCAASTVFGKKVRSFSPQRVVREIEACMEEYGIREVSFWDDTMTVNKNWMMNLCNLIIEKRLDITWTCYGHVNTVTRELLFRMKEAGCFNIFYGFESGDQGMLNNIRKGITLDRIRTVKEWTKEAGIEIRASFMLGLPGETPALAEKTIDFAISLDPDYAQFSLTTPYPGTTLYEIAKEYGNLDMDFTKYHGWNPVFLPHGYKDREELLNMERQAMRRFYLRPGYILKRLKKINSIEDIKRNIKGFCFALGFMRD
ncbi:MAG: B12-binding domain-containing radical SAM protein [Thermodesulfobacteriota bacterium]